MRLFDTGEIIFADYFGQGIKQVEVALVWDTAYTVINNEGLRIYIKHWEAFKTREEAEFSKYFEGV